MTSTVDQIMDFSHLKVTIDEFSTSRRDSICERKKLENIHLVKNEVENIFEIEAGFKICFHCRFAKWLQKHA